MALVCSFVVFPPSYSNKPFFPPDFLKYFSVISQIFNFQGSVHLHPALLCLPPLPECPFTGKFFYKQILYSLLDTLVVVYVSREDKGWITTGRREGRFTFGKCIYVYLLNFVLKGSRICQLRPQDYFRQSKPSKSRKTLYLPLNYLNVH